MRLPPVQIFPAMLAVVMTVGCLGRRHDLGGAVASPPPSPGMTTPAASPPPVAFLSVVCRDYPAGGSLDGWLLTRDTLQATLASWFGSPRLIADLVDPAPEPFRRALARTREAVAGEILVVYLGARQTAAGECLFNDGSKIGWDRLFPPDPPPADLAQRTFYILDVCHAETAFARAPGLLRHGNWLVGSGKGQYVFQRDLASRRGYDFRRRHPAAWQWFQKTMPPGTPSKISHTGLVWLAALDPCPPPPATPAALQSFLETCVRTSRGIAESSALKGASTLSIRRCQP